MSISRIFKKFWQPPQAGGVGERVEQRNATTHEAHDIQEPVNRLGLFSLSPPEPSPGSEDARKQTTLDVVALHGLGGDPFNTWKHKDTGKIWLRDFVHESIENVHIMSFGYNSGVAFTCSFSNVEDFAKDLLASLVARRRSLGTSGNPIIFVCHSLGGIVFKKALITAHERQSIWGDLIPLIKGAMFFGTPHRGSDLAFWARTLSSVAQVPTLGAIRTDLQKDLQTKSRTLGNICSGFVERAAPLQIVTFYERVRIKGLQDLIVDETSAILQLPNEVPIPIEADHSSMCKFLSPSSTSYEVVIDQLTRLAHFARETASALPEVARGASPAERRPTQVYNYTGNSADGNARMHNGHSIVYNSY